ncbi:unnamed protein product [Camellia sinensis]
MESKFASFSCIVFIVVVFFFLCSTQTTISLQTNIIFNATVAQDGSGNYRRINDAIAAAPMHISVTNRYYIRVKPGVYSEYVVVGEDKTNIALIGDDAATTKITGNRSNAIGFGTPQSATMTVDGEGFIGQSLTIENSAPINSGQAVALNNNANHSAFYKCIFMGYQDTLLANTNSQFYKNCEISGTVDFIFGFASAVFQDCGIYVRRLSPANVITANGGKPNPASTNFGFSFQNCTINVAPELRSRKKEVKAFLGRPWQNYATVVFMESYLDEIVLPEGWTWCCNNTIMMFAEYNNRGPGANTSRRAKLSGYKVFQSAAEATPFTVSKLIDGDSWIPQTGIPYRGGLNSVAPYNTFYSQLEVHMDQVGIEATINRWDDLVALGVVDPHDTLSHLAGMPDVQAESVHKFFALCGCGCYLIRPPQAKRGGTNHELVLKISKASRGKRLSEDISKLARRTNMFDNKFLGNNLFTHIMIIHNNMFCAGMENRI